jgi:protein TonB
MHALEDAPDEKGRYRRMGFGASAVALLGVGLLFAAEHVAPMRKLRDSVIQMAVVTTPDIPLPLEPLPPPPPLPPEPPQAKPKAKPKTEPVPSEQAKTPPVPSEEQVGLDNTSFGEGTGGPAFHVGTTQMGAPTGRPIGGTAATTAAAVLGPPPKLVEARAVQGNPAPEYSDAARKANVEGLMVVEVSIDERGRVLRARVRSGLHPELDAIATKTVQRWSFEPATLAGKSVASTKFLRIRFDLQ